MPPDPSSVVKSSTNQGELIDAILRDLESWRELIKQDLKPNVRRSLEPQIRKAEDRLRDITERRG